MMTKKRFNIGILTLETYVAYGAIEYFNNCLIEALKQHGNNVYRLKSVSNYIDVVKSDSMDFTINIGKYLFYDGATPLYEKYKIPHYNWVIDNPLKLSLDLNSSYIHYILIDKEFMDIDVINFINKPIFLPLATSIASKGSSKVQTEVLFVGQIKNINRIYNEIKLLPEELKSHIIYFIELVLSKLDSSFIKSFNGYVKQHKLTNDIELVKNIFKFSNTYIRALKRKKVISSIKDIPLTIFGGIEDAELIKQRNLTIFQKSSYRETLAAYSNSKISINVSPNFSYGCHDRILNSFIGGACCLTDRNPYIESFFRDDKDIVYFDYKHLDNLQDKIHILLSDNKFNNLNKNGLKVVKKNFLWAKIIEELICQIMNN